MRAGQQAFGTKAVRAVPGTFRNSPLPLGQSLGGKYESLSAQLHCKARHRTWNALRTSHQSPVFDVPMQAPAYLFACTLYGL